MIKNISRENIEECVNVVIEGFMTIARQYGFTKEGSPLFTAFDTNVDKLIKQYDEEKRPLIAYYVGDRIVGYYSIHRISEEECELNNLSVLPEYRHGGIGRKLVSHAYDLAKSKGYKSMIIEIVEDNLVLRKWYLELGFEHYDSVKYDNFQFICYYMRKIL